MSISCFISIFWVGVGTVCPKSLDLFYTVSLFIKWVKFLGHSLTPLFVSATSIFWVAVGSVCIDPFNILCFFLKSVKTSWTFSNNILCFLRRLYFGSLLVLYVLTHLIYYVSF